MTRRPNSIRLLAALLVAALCLAALPAVAPAQTKKFTLEDVLDYSKFYVPGPSQIMWLPGGESFLYFFREDGANTLWRYDCASGEKTAVAEWGEVQKALREQQVERQQAAMGDVNATGRFSRAALSLSPDGTALMGSMQNDLYLFDIASGESRFITDDLEPEIFPTFSPDGKKVAFAREGDLYVLDIDSGGVTRLTERPGTHILNGVADWVYEEELGVRSSFWWAPCSSRIAYIQFDTSPVKTFPITDDLTTPVSDHERQQYPKAGDPNSIVRLGVVAIDAAPTAWVDTGDEADFYIRRVGWVPGSGELWYQWLNRDQTRLELRYADPATGASRLVTTDEDPAWVGTRITKLTYVDDDRFIWASEKDGWQHLYLHKTDGSLIGRITSGEWEVSDICGFDSARGTIVFAGTKESPLESHIYRIGLDGSGMTRLTQEEGSHNASMPEAGDYLIHTWSSPTVMTQMQVGSLDGATAHHIYDGRSPALDDYELAVPEYFTVTAEDGATLYASMIKPLDFDPTKKYPVLVSIYGGPESQMVRKSAGRSMFYQLLAQEGIIVFSIDNRGTAGRGRDWCRAVHRNLGYWEVQDHVEGIKYLKTLPYIDGERIGIYGGSYGGYMVLMAMVKAPEHFQVGVCSYPVTDWGLYDTIYTERYMDTPQDNPEGYRVSAPVSFADKLEGRLLLIHGLMDNNVHFQNSVCMIEALVKAGKRFDLMVYPRERHGIRAPHRREYNTRLIYDFIMRELKGATE